jgi:hypothetical protein
VCTGDPFCCDIEWDEFCAWEAGLNCGPLCGDADLDGDGHVGPADLSMLLGQWGTAGSADFDGNGNVGAPDLSFLLASWG